MKINLLLINESGAFWLPKYNDPFLA